MNIIFYQLKRPYLLANRLNNYTAADLLVKIGNASRQQMDEKVFYDAERWKHEGQLEAYKRYLKAKKCFVFTKRKTVIEKGKLSIFKITF